MQSKHWMKIVWQFTEQLRGKMLFSVVCAVVSVLSGMVPYLAVYRIIMLFVAGNPELSQVTHYILIGGAGYLIKQLCHGLSTITSHRCAYQILENIRLALTQRLMAAPLGKVLSSPIGELKGVIVDRVETIEMPLAHIIPEGISNFILPIAVFIYLFQIDWRMALASLGTLPLAALAYGHMMKNFNEKYNQYMASSNAVNGIIVEYIEGIEVIKAFNQSSQSYEKYERAVENFKEDTLEWFQSTWGMMNLGGTLLPSTLLFTVPVGFYLYSQGVLAPGDLTMCLILSMGIVGPLTSFTVFVNDIKAIQYAVETVEDYLHLPILKEKKEKVILKDYSLSLDRVSFSYDGEGDKPILQELSMTIPSGKFYALVGASGSGKSTVAKLLARFWDVDQGEISIGQVPIQDIPQEQLADTVSYVAQDNFLFQGSLIENIRLGKPQATYEEVIEASQQACCHEFIMALEKGYDCQSGEAGNRLSGGEKQRIALARAILKDAPIIVLDEATAFTDPENEHKIQQGLGALTQQKTVLMIAHRLSTVKKADKILVMDQGRIIAADTHSELLRYCDTYQKMWEAHIGSHRSPMAQISPVKEAQHA